MKTNDRFNLIIILLKITKISAYKLSVKFVFVQNKIVYSYFMQIIMIFTIKVSAMKKYLILNELKRVYFNII
jgi:hypothetical protein